MKEARCGLSRWAYHLSMLEAAVRSGSVGEAAAGLGMTARDVSQALRELEAAMGTRLFTRSRKRLELTRAGQILHAAVLAGSCNIRQVAGRMSSESPSRANRARGVEDSVERSAVTGTYRSRHGNRRRIFGVPATPRDH